MPRFQPYLSAAGNDPELALDLYEWNLEASAAFWEVIAVVEVVTRNAMHDQLTNAYGAHWYDNTAIVDDRSLKVIREAKRRASRGLPKSTPASPGKVVSEMSFGAWVSLLDQGGHSTTQSSRLRYHDTLWLPALQHAFPNGPAHQKKDQPWPPHGPEPPEPHRPPREDLQRALQRHPADPPGTALALPRRHPLGLSRGRGVGRIIKPGRRGARGAARRDLAARPGSDAHRHDLSTVPLPEVLGSQDGREPRSQPRRLPPAALGLALGNSRRRRTSRQRHSGGGQSNNAVIARRSRT